MRLEHILPNYTCEIPYKDMTVKVRRFLLSVTDGGIFAPTHAHKYYEFHYIVSGKGKVTIENTEFDVSAGSIFFTKPYINHSEISDDKDPMIQYTVECSIDFPDKCKKSIDDFEIKNIERILNDVYLEAFEDDRGVIEKFDYIRKLAEEKKIGFLLKTKLLVLDCLIDTVMIVAKKDAVKYPVSKESINEKRATIIKTFIDVNIAKNITIHDVCRQVYLSSRHVNRIFLDKYNQTIAQYILDAKINLVKKKLIDTSESIEAISLEVGFSSYQQMYRAFVREVHMTPNRFRQANKKT